MTVSTRRQVHNFHGLVFNAPIYECLICGSGFPIEAFLSKSCPRCSVECEVDPEEVLMGRLRYLGTGGEDRCFYLYGEAPPTGFDLTASEGGSNGEQTVPTTRGPGRR